MFILEAPALSWHFHLFALDGIWNAKNGRLESFRTFTACNLYTLWILHYLTTILAGWLGGNVTSLFIPGHLLVGILSQIVVTLTCCRLGWYMMSLFVPGTFRRKILANFTRWFDRYVMGLFKPRQLLLLRLCLLFENLSWETAIFYRIRILAVRLDIWRRAQRSDKAFTWAAIWMIKDSDLRFSSLNVLVNTA